MAVLKRSLRRKNATGNYDTIRLESDSSIVYRPSGRTVEQDLAAYLPSTQSSDVVPKTLVFGKLLSATNKFWVGNSNNAPIELVTALNIGDYVGGSGGGPEIIAPEYPGTIPALGKTFSFVRYTWLVVHKEGSIAYCVTNDILKNVQWVYDNRITGYFGSNIQMECQKMAISTGIQYADYVLDVGAGKVFIPSHEQIKGEEGGFSWFDSNLRRKANYNGTAANYWTSSGYQDGQYLSVWHVNSSGKLNYNFGVSISFGFRPCIAISW